MKTDTYKIIYGCGVTDDITFCAEDCSELRCFRNSKWIIDKSSPHSFAHFKGTKECLKESEKQEMTDNPKEYYKDENGEQYIDYVRRTYGEELYFWWSVITAGKYLHRCGKKVGNEAEKDLAKVNDYIAYAKNSNFARTELGRHELSKLYAEYFKIIDII